jgi:hypothetical protein
MAIGKKTCGGRNTHRHTSVPWMVVDPATPDFARRAVTGTRNSVYCYLYWSRTTQRSGTEFWRVQLVLFWARARSGHYSRSDAWSAGERVPESVWEAGGVYHIMPNEPCTEPVTQCPWSTTGALTSPTLLWGMARGPGRFNVHSQHACPLQTSSDHVFSHCYSSYFRLRQIMRLRWLHSIWDQASLISSSFLHCIKTYETQRNIHASDVAV